MRINTSSIAAPAGRPLLPPRACDATGRRHGDMKTLTSIACALLLICAPAAFAQSKQLERDNKMSAMGKRAAAVVAKITRKSESIGARKAVNALADEDEDEGGRCINEPDCGEED